MTRRLLTWTALLGAVLLGAVLFAFGSCSGGSNYVGTGSGSTPAVTTTYTVTFEVNGGSEVSSQTVESGKTATEPTKPEKSGYTFGGWYDDSALTSAFSFSTEITKDTTLYAKWISASTPTYTVSFETNGGSTVTSQTVASGGKATKPTAPTKSGFVFLDWYADSTFTAKYDFSAPVTADTTVYARWWDSTGFVLAEGGVVGEIAGSNVFISGRTVTVASLWACDHEVTQGEYETYCTYGGDAPSDTLGVGANYPAYYVNWYEALVYCNKRSLAEGLTPCYTIGGKTDPAEWGAMPTSSDATWNAAVQDMTANGYRLPTEAEWEYLVRGGKDGATGTQTTYAGSDTLDDMAWYTTNSGGKAHEVKGKNPISSSFKLHDMSGNVWEWCWDWYGTVAADTPAAGASSGSSRVRRGGSWSAAASYCAVSNQVSSNPYSRGSVGLRVVRSSSE